jgi:carbon-monoxide dehydrogenase large subunit
VSEQESGRDDLLLAHSTRRREDRGLILGQTPFVDDIRLADERPHTLHMLVVRSPYGHARIESIDTEAASRAAGVVAVVTGRDLVGKLAPLEGIRLPGMKVAPRLPLAVDSVRYVGDPVAVVLAETRYLGADARDLVDVTYTPLPAVTDVEAAADASAPLLYEEFGSNIAFAQSTDYGDVADVFASAQHTLRLRLVNQRVAPCSLEPRACSFDYDAQHGELYAWMSTQAVFRVQEILSRYLGLPQERVHVRNAAVGGAFGAKNALLGEELVAAWLALTCARPVKWIEERSENLQASAQGRGQLNDVEAAFQDDGRLLGLKIRTLADIGAFLVGVSAMMPMRTPTLACGPYRVQAIASDVTCLYTNKPPSTPYRGAGRPEATYILERVMDEIARLLALDPAEVRRRNFLPPEAFPYQTVTAMPYDSGDYPALLTRLLELGEYEDWRHRQQEQRAQGGTRLSGLGLSTFNEVCGDGRQMAAGGQREAAVVRLRRDGTLLVHSGVAHNGQGHFTLFAQIAAGVFALPVERVEVAMNDADLPVYSIGTFGSRVTQVGASVVLLAARALRTRVIQLAARILEVAPEDLQVVGGQVTVRGVPGRALALGDLASRVEEHPALLEEVEDQPAQVHGIEGLACWRDFAPEGPAFSAGAHLAVVEVDTETGDITVLRYVAVDDCGRVLNRDLAEMQLHGALAQGFGQALCEETRYDQQGQVLSGSLLDYALPLAKELPTFTSDFIETLSPTNPLGVKGIGESGTIGAPPALVNAVLDALAPLGVRALDMPLTREKVWQSIQRVGQAGR